MTEIPPELAELAVRQFLAFDAGDPAFVDMVGEVFLDEGRTDLSGPAQVAAGFAGLLQANRRRAAPPPAVEVKESLDLDSMRQAAASPQTANWTRQLAAMLDQLREGDRLVWLEVTRPTGGSARFFNVFRESASGWKVIAFGF